MLRKLLADRIARNLLQRYRLQLNATRPVPMYRANLGGLALTPTRSAKDICLRYGRLREVILYFAGLLVYSVAGIWLQLWVSEHHW